jgi:hypothetical protein
VRSSFRGSRGTWASEALTSASKPLTWASEALTSASKSLTGANGALTSASKSLTGANGALTSASKPLTSASKPLTSASESLTSASKPLTWASESLTPTAMVVFSQVIPPIYDQNRELRPEKGGDAEASAASCDAQLRVCPSNKMGKVMNRNKLIQSNADMSLLAGLQKHFASTASLTFGGASHTPAEIQTALANRTAATTATAAATTTFHNAVAEEKQVRSGTQKLVADFRAFAMSTFGDDLEALADFGLKPRKKAVRSPETQVVAAQKSLATRKARGTKGKKQKAAIKGTIEVPVTPPAGTTAPSK